MSEENVEAMSQENIELFFRRSRDAFDRGDLEAWLGFIHPDLQSRMSDQVRHREG
jgi:hypothetical protein